MVTPETSDIRPSATNGLSKTVLHFDRPAALSQSWVRSLCEDQEGDLWVGSGSGGLVCLRAGQVTALTPPDRWQGRTVRSVSQGRDGSVWITTEGAGLYRFKDEAWQQFGV